jgi:hypothetical protein
MGVRAHAFHRWAHHPLCEEYAGERLRFGRTHVCRGCLFLGVGAGVGLMAGSVAPVASPLVTAASAVAASLWAGVVWRSMQRERALPAGPHAIPPPRPKIATRLLPAAIATFSGIVALRTGGAVGGVGVALLLVVAAGAWLGYRRLGPQRRPCASCPEAVHLRACRGYAAITRRERAFSRLAGRWLGAAPTR